MNTVLVLSYVLLLLATLVLFLPVISDLTELSETQVGYLRRGRTGAVLTALTALRADGVIEPHPQGGMRRTKRPAPSTTDQLERAVYGTLHDPGGPKALLNRLAIRRSLDTHAKRLVNAGLLPGPVRLLAGRAMLITVAVLAVVRPGAGTIVATVVAVGLWLPSRRTIAGHAAFYSVRSQHRADLADGGDPDSVAAWNVALGLDRGLVVAERTGYGIDTWSKKDNTGSGGYGM